VRWEKLTKGTRVKIRSDQSRSGQRRNRVAFMMQSVNWVLDADGRSFFDSVDHEWLLRMVAH
jgi:retron-type reverse transcriptase